MAASSPPNTPLPRGFGALPASESRALHRARLLAAVDAMVAEHGFDALSVSAIVRRAGVSKSTFYEHFRDKRAAYLACWEAYAIELRATIEAAVAEAPAGDWAAMIHLGTVAYLRSIAERPAAARVFTVEVLSAGPEALAQRAALRASFTDLYAGARALAGRPALDPQLLRALVEGVQGLVDEWIRAGRTAELEQLAPTVERLVSLVLDSR